MNLFTTVLGVVFPVIALATVGFVWARSGAEYPIPFVTRLATQVAVPCLIFVSLMETEIAPTALVEVSLATLIGYALLLVLSWGFVRLSGLDARTYIPPLAFGNTGNLGLPLALFAFGAEGLGYAVVILSVMIALSFTLGVWIVAGKGNGSAFLKEPMVWATLLGGLFLVMEWRLPGPLTDAVALIGQMGIPLMLITLGVAVAGLQVGNLAKALILSLGKIAVCASVGWGVALVLELEQVAAAALILQMAMPVAVTAYMLAEKYGADAETVAGLVVVSTLLSGAAIPLLLAVLL